MSDTPTTSIERLPLPVPASFDHTNPGHVAKVVAKVVEKHGLGWEVEAFDTSARTLVLTRQRALTEVLTSTTTNDGSIRVALGKGTTEADGPRLVTKFETAHDGYYVSEFEPFKGYAVMTRLNEAELNCRAGIAAALGVKPWKIQCRQVTRGQNKGGYEFAVPSTYVPKTHYPKLDENLRRVGRPGWYMELDERTLRGRYVVAEMPTFEPVYEFDFRTMPKDPAGLTDKERFTLPLGVKLGINGRPNTELTADLSNSVGMLLVGLAGSGKSTCVQSVVMSALARGFRLALIDTVDKKNDLEWAKPFVEPHMWGCESVAAAVTVAKLVNEEGARMSTLMADHGVGKWQDLPKDVKAANPPLMVVADELAALLTADPIPAGLSKEMKALPEFVQMQQDLLEAKLLATALGLGPSLYRAAGIRFIYLTQQPNERYGFSMKLKGNLPHRVMLGVNPSESEKGHAFRTPEKVPEVPHNIATVEEIARGVGLAHLDGSEATVFKGYWASLDDYLHAAAVRGFKTTTEPEPTPAQIARLVPRIDDGGFPDDGPAASAFDAGGFGQADGRDIASRDRLRGAAKASKNLAMEAALAAKRKAQDAA